MGASTGLVAEQPELSRCRADEGKLGRRTGLGEVGILRKEAVARVDGIAPGCLRRSDHARDVEIGGSAPACERKGLVDPPDVQRARIVLRIQACRGETEFGGGLGDTDGDLAAVGDQEFLEHDQPVSR